jgi:endonuclease-3
MEKSLRKIIGILRKRYDLRENRRNPFRVLIHVILAARTTDLVSWPAADRLIKKGGDAKGISKMDVRKIEKIILPSNFYKTKARRVKAACGMLVKRFKGKVPRTREELMSLPGVGGKSADIVMSFCYDEPVIAVDAHVKWVSHVLDISHERDPEKVRARLHEIFPKGERSKVNDLFVQFGKEICNTGRPKCWMCPVSKLCPYGKKRMQQRISVSK